MKVVLKKQKKIPFEFEGLKGNFICENPKASEYVSFWAKYRNIEGTEETKAKAQAELVTSQFLSFISKVEFEKETTFEDEEGKPIDPKDAMSEYFSIVLFHVGMQFLNPNIGGTGKDPLELSSKGS